MARLLAVPQLETRDAISFAFPAPKYVTVRIDNVQIELPEIAEVPKSLDFEPTGPYQQMQGVARLAFATGGIQRIESFERQLALTCAAFSKPEARRQYLPPSWKFETNPLAKFAGLAFPKSASGLASFAEKDLSDAWLTNASLSDYRRQIFPLQPDYLPAQTEQPALELAQRTLRAWRNAARNEARARARKIAAIENATREAGIERMRSSMEQAAVWLARYSNLQRTSDTKSAVAMLANKKMPPIAIEQQKPIVEDLHRRMMSMKPLAFEVRNTRAEVTRFFTESSSAADFDEATQRLVGPAMARYAAEIGVHAVHHPILFRTPPEVLLDAVDHGLVKFEKPLGLLLHRLYQSARHMRALLDKAKPQASQLDFSDDGWLSDVDVEARIAAAVIDDDLLWRHPNLIYAGLAKLQETQADENLKCASAVLEALAPLRQQRARNQMGLAVVETVGLVAVDLLLTAIAPPLGAAFSVAVSGKGVYDSIGEYDETSATFFCTLDPASALSEQAPDGTSVALSVAFAALDMAPILRGVKKVIQ
jgi:hypothetical protein